MNVRPPLALPSSPAADEAPASQALATALDSASGYATESLSAGTRRAYRHDWQYFVAWCAAVGASPLPASVDTIAAFAAAEADAGLAAPTLTRRLAAIRAVHEGQHQPYPRNDPALRKVMRGIRNRQKGRTVVKKQALLDTHLMALVDTLDPRTLAGARDRALLLVGFTAALRRSELVRIEIEHLDFQSEGLALTIPYAKTDQTGEGAVVPVPVLPDSRYCPVSALQHWLKASGLTEGAVFRRLRRGPCVGAAALSDSAVAKLVKRCAAATGMADVSGLSGHSLRRGFVTTAVRHREDSFAIAAQSRHRSLDTVREYVEAETRFDNHPVRRMFGEIS